MMEESQRESLLEGENAAYLDMLYERYLHDPLLVDSSWRDYFSNLPIPADLQQGIRHSEVMQQFRTDELFNYAKPCQTNGAELQRAVEIERHHIHIIQLIKAYRVLGHLEADTNPLGKLHQQPHSHCDELTLPYYRLDHLQGDDVFDTGDFLLTKPATVQNIYQALRTIYTGSMGIEYMHIMDTEEKCWLQAHFESCEAQERFSVAEKIELYEQLVAAETFERYLHARYVGQKTFSLEGGESLIPLLHCLNDHAGKHQIKELSIGMAHRGRLNVLHNVLGKPPAELFSEFEGAQEHEGYAGDVKYHKGYSADIQTSGGMLRIAVAFNPSHLEIISPVVAGHTRVRRDVRQANNIDNADNTDEALAIMIHGDAAFAGQGVVMETLNMSQTRGFSIGGTIHIVINNQIGFTTSTHTDSRSTYYPTDVAKMVNAPILHVNGDDPEAVVYTAQLALEYRRRFNKDIVIDLVCYRLRGHNEADEPSLTQPLMYQAIRSKLTTRQLYGNRLIEEGILSEQRAKAAITDYKARLEKGHSLCNILDINSIPEKYQVNWGTYKNRHWTDPADTTFDASLFNTLAHRCFSLPKGFIAHERLQKVLTLRQDMLQGNKLIDWGFAENMAYATLLSEGYDVRLSGQDSGRGTFSHRHAVYHHQHEPQSWIPLQHLTDDQGQCTITDSLLSEEAVLAFEYGYATSAPEVLVIWEAQFGDFANGAQVVIDQFISSGEQKWERLSGLTLFLPHGYEGMGAEHSTARIERYLQLCAEHNMQVCIPTTPAQIYHLLRRQMIRPYRKPLIVFTPKSLLRHPRVTSSLEELYQSAFHPILDDELLQDKTLVNRIILCSGKVYYDLLARREQEDIIDIALLRIEQLYPFPKNRMHKLLDAYMNASELVWCQEEPLNQGAWDGIKHRFRNCNQGGGIFCISRPSSAAAATGSKKEHKQQQQLLIETALRVEHSYDD
jgi:2-oxoglutarate dehydrogenase E1 component